MKKIMVIALVINTYVLAMEHNLGHRFNEDEKDDGVQLLDVIENKKTPRGHARSEKIDTLDERISKTKLMIQNGVKQPFSTWFGALNYVKEHAIKDELYECYLCKVKFNQAVSAAGCFLRHYDPNLFACDQCGCVTESSKSYKNHTCITKVSTNNKKERASSVPAASEDFLRSYVNEKLAAIYCCDIPLGNWATALNHSSLKHKESRVKYRCNFCKKIHPTNEKALECYVIHKDKSIFECPSCNTFYTNRATLLDHRCKPKKVPEPSADLDELEIALTNNSNSLSTHSLETDEHNQASFDDHFTMQYEDSINNFCISDAESSSAIEKDETRSVFNPLHTTHYNFERTNCDYNPSDFSDGQTPLFADQLLDEKNYSFNSQANNIHPNQIGLSHQDQLYQIFNTITQTYFIVKPLTLEGHTFDLAGSEEYNRSVLSKVIISRLDKHSYSCCSQKNINWDSFRRHLSDNHRCSEGEKIICPECNTMWSSVSTGYYHVAFHQNQELFNCPLCKTKNRVTRHITKYYLQKHFRECLAEESRLQGITRVQESEKKVLKVKKSVKDQKKIKKNDTSIIWIDYSAAEYEQLKKEKKSINDDLPK